MGPANNPTNGNSNSWENVYIFISSTFNDMHAERDYLVKKVFPELSGWCEERRLRLIDIDLRWGITEADSEKNKRVVDVCLSNIDKCRPLFICFLGQRRGWIPTEQDIASFTFDNFPKLKQYIGSSVTEMEITHALIDPMLNGSVLDIKNRERAFFFMRNPSYLQSIQDQAIRNIYTNEGERDPEFTDKKLEDFKNNLRTNSERPVFDYSAEWNSNATTPELVIPGKPENIGHGRLVNFKCADKELSETIIDSLKNAITELYPGRGKSIARTVLEKEMEEQFRFLQNAVDGFIERTGDFDEILRYINSSDHRPCAVVADAGTGKTSYLASLTQKLEERPDVNVIYRFTGTSENSVSVGRMLPSVVSEISSRFDVQNLPSELQKIKNTLPEILEKVSVKTGKKTILIIDAINQLESGLKDLSWIPVYLTENVKFIYSFKSDDTDGALLCEQLSEDDTCLIKLKPFESLDDRRALISQYLSRYLKELDEYKIQQLITSDGTDNPLFLKVLLSELKVFGSHEGVRDMISGKFGTTPISAFTGILERLEHDPGYSKIPGESLVRNMFGWLSHSKNGLEAKELAELLVDNHYAETLEDAEDSVNLILRQIRPFLAKRDTKNDFFYESFMLAARKRYTDENAGGKPDAQWHKELYNYFAKRKFSDKRKIYEGAYHAAYAGLSDQLIILFTSYVFISNKTYYFGINDTIEEFNLVTLPEAGLSDAETKQFLLIRDALEMGAPMININRDQIAIQLYARLQDFDMPIIKKLLANIYNNRKNFNEPWMRPLYSFLKQPGGSIIRNYDGAKAAELFSDGRRMLVNDSIEQSVKLVETFSGKVLRNYPIKIKPDKIILFEEYNLFAIRSTSFLDIVNMETGEETQIKGISGTSSSQYSSYKNFLLLTGYQSVGNVKYAYIVDVVKKEIIKTLEHTIPSLTALAADFDVNTGYLYVTHKENQLSVYDSNRDFVLVNDLDLPNVPNHTEPSRHNFIIAPKGEDFLITKTVSEGIALRSKASGEAIWKTNQRGQISEPIAVSADHKHLACGYFGTVRVYSIPEKRLLMTLSDSKKDSNTNSISSLLFAGSDRHLYVGRIRGQIELWNIEDGSLLKLFSENDFNVIEMKEDIHKNLVLLHGGGVCVLDPSKEEASLPEEKPCRLSVIHAVLAPNDEFLIAVCLGNHVYRIDLPSMECRELINNEKDSFSFDSPIITCDSKYFALRYRLETLKFYDCTTGESVGEMVAAKVQCDSFSSGYSENKYRIWDPYFLPKKCCVGKRNLTVVYRQSQFIVIQDADEPDSLRYVLPFKDKSPAWLRITKNEENLLVKSSKNPVHDSAKSDVTPLTSDAAILLDLSSLTCIKHSESFEELYLNEVNPEGFVEINKHVEKYYKCYSVINNGDNPVDIICRRPGMTLYNICDKSGLWDKSGLAVKNAETGKTVCSYVSSYLPVRFFSKDGKYIFAVSSHTLSAFALENVFESTNVNKENLKQKEILESIRKENMEQGDKLKKDGKLN